MEQEQLGRRASKTREEIYSAAMELFARRGVANVSMQSIADRAETARSTVFKHYPQKLALLSDFYMRLANDALTGAKSKNTTGFKSGMTALFRAMQRVALEAEPILREVAGLAVGNGPLAAEEAAVDDQLIVHIAGLLSSGVTTGEVHDDIDIRGAAGLILCVITETNQAAIRNDRVRHLARDQQKRLNLLFRGLGTAT